MPGSPVPVGREVTFTKTVSESDVYLYAGITGDFSPNHVNQTYMERSAWGRRMAHGMLLVGFVSTASTMAIADTREDTGETPVAVGMDRLRFLKPVFIGDTVTVSYRIEGFDADETAHRRKGRAQEPGRRARGGRRSPAAVGEERVAQRSAPVGADGRRHPARRLRCRRASASHAAGGRDSVPMERESRR